MLQEVRILDVRPRPSCHAGHAGRCFGSNVAANWGFHYHDLIEEPKPREVVTIFELDTSGEPFAKAVYNYVWTPQTDPDGIVHPTIDYPGVRVDHGTIRKRENILSHVKVPARLHFGTMGLAPSESDFVSSIPPSYTGGNIDDWRIGKGARMYYPVAVHGAFFSVGDPHAAQGDSELGGTAIETSLTGDFEFILHKHRDLGGTALEGLSHPMLETDKAWSVYGFTYPNYLADLGPDAQTEIANLSSLDRAMRDAFRKLRRFLMTVHRMSEDEAISLMSVGADFRSDPGGRCQLGRSTARAPEERLQVRLTVRGWNPRKSSGPPQNCRPFKGIRQLYLVAIGTTRAASLLGTEVASIPPVWGRNMSFRPFTSESYSEDDRLEAWRDVLGAVGLQPSAASTVHTGHATASRRNAEGVVLAKLAAGPQVVAPLPHRADDVPMVLLPMEDGVTLEYRHRPTDHFNRAPAAVAAKGRLERVSSSATCTWWCCR